MSKQQPPGSRFINTLLIAALAYTGFLLIFNSQNRSGPERPAAEILQSMRADAAGLRDVTLSRTLPTYNQALGEEAKRTNMPEAVRRQLELEAAVLVADAEFKSAIYRQKVDKANAARSYDKLNRAYMTIKTQWNGRHTSPEWTQPVPVTPAPRLDLPATTATPKEVYDRIVAQLSAESKTHLVYGLFPGYPVIDFLVNLTGAVPGFSYWFAALLLALAVRAIILPLAHKQIMWGRQMGQLKPYMEELKAKFTDKKTGQVTDQQAFTAETMKMYKEYGINPMAGCGPMLIQLPFFLAVYQCMLQYKFEFTKGSFLWIHPGSTQFLGIPLAPNLGEMDYILIAIYGVSMVVATLLQPITDPANAKQQRLMGLGIAVFFSIMMFFWPLPSAFVVYWTFTNILSTAQSLITYRLPLPPLTKVATVKGGSLPIGPADEGGVKVDKFKGAKPAMPKKITPKKKTPKKP